MELPILYEDEQMLVINKPAGVMTHPDGHSTEETVSDWFAARYPASANVGETQTLANGTVITRPGIVHRLDKDTSGVLLLAKTPESHAFLKEAFQSRDVHKTYLAIVYGAMKEKSGTIDFAIGRSRKDFRLRSAQPKAKGTMREAITNYEVVGEHDGYTLLKAMPLTGRTHQIRVHLKAIHHPIVCDPLYAPNHPCAFGLGRVALHAYQIAFPMMNGEKKTLTATLPPDFTKAVEKFEVKLEG